ncbi:MAG: riboflavin synthase [Gemmatimonadota bacterium]|nr:riboflavin synthase [Gemmatimonadota bacterium]
MFTGIVRSVGRVARREEGPDAVRLAIEGADFLPELDSGDSVAVSGVCLTVSDLEDTRFTVEAVRATVERTTIGEWTPGDPVNLEPALRAGDPLGGHMVQGHIDHVGVVESVRSAEDSRIIEVTLPAEVAAVTVPQGSLAIDGVSLTVNALHGAVARFAIIPYTWSHTTLNRLARGARVNVEADVIGKYVGKALRPYAPASSPDLASSRPTGDDTI